MIAEFGYVAAAAVVYEIGLGYYDGVGFSERVKGWGRTFGCVLDAVAQSGGGVGCERGGGGVNGVCLNGVYGYGKALPVGSGYGVG